MKHLHVACAAAIAFLSSLSTSLAVTTNPPSRKLNLIAIVTDDQGQWAVGTYGNHDVITPNMDRLATEGALFVNAFANTPVCSPSRASYLTGMEGTELGITDWINMNEAANGVGLPANILTWPRILQQNGYATALIGKWHLGDLPQNHPTREGYDYFWGFLGGGTEPMNPHIEVDGKVTQLKGPVSDLMTDRAIHWLETHRDKPFALSLHFREPHLPYGPVPEEDSAPFRNADVKIPDVKGLDLEYTRNLTRQYYSAIHAVDRNLGRLLARLDQLKLSGNTIILFTSDNGYNVGHHGLHMKGNAISILGGVPGPKRPNMFEESVRIPLIIRWPGVIIPGTRIDQPVTNVDTYATVLGMLGLNAPNNPNQHGRDFSPILRGSIPSDWPTDVFGQYDLHNQGLAFMRMIRTDNGWKLIRFHMSNGANELFNLKLDPGEKHNRYYDKRVFGIRDALQQRLTAWEESVHDPILKLDANRPIEQGPPVGQ